MTPSSQVSRAKTRMPQLSEARTRVWERISSRAVKTSSRLKLLLRSCGAAIVCCKRPSLPCWLLSWLSVSSSLSFFFFFFFDVTLFLVFFAIVIVVFSPLVFSRILRLSGRSFVFNSVRPSVCFLQNNATWGRRWRSRSSPMAGTSGCFVEQIIRVHGLAQLPNVNI
ncbi:hypothetical protein JOL62DRAFT_587390 [Phyllosticta paracitricarpa]|uniref:Transmembrane protein n=1 Tax=Phyllosticta paracitricarpa TaxID=2016321 RepID=A0ABR1MTU2_9PEZI